MQMHRYKPRKLLHKMTIVFSVLLVFYPVIYVFLFLPVSNIWNQFSHSHQPHIVLVVADDLGWSDVSWNNPSIVTPNLHTLATNGVILNSSYVSPCCTPSRASLLTGYYPHRIGLQYWVIEGGDRWIPLTFDLLPQKLKEIGYSTHGIGKWHLGHCSLNHTPTYRGFDSFFGFYSGKGTYYTHRYDGYYDLNLNNEIYRDQKKQYSTYLFRDRAMQIIRDHDVSKPLFLYLPFQAVHGPLEVPNKYQQLYESLPRKRSTYCGMVTAMDEAIGDVVKALESRGFMDNLLLVFISDNGGHPNLGGYNWPLRGIKHTLWEGGTRSTGFVYSKTLLQRTNYVNNHIINVADWFPTLLEAAGVQSTSPDLDGVSQWETIRKGENPSRTENVQVYGIGDRAALRVNEFKLMKGDPSCKQRSPGGSCLYRLQFDNGWTAPNDIQQDSKLGWPVTKDYSLYNIITDPLEENEISEKFPDVVERLKSRLEYHTQRSVGQVKALPVTERYRKNMNRHKVILPGWCDDPHAEMSLLSRDT